MVKPMNSQLRYLNWRFYKAKRRLRRVFYSRLYRETNHDTKKSILITGTARSGTTWLADILSFQLNGRIMFEPFHSRKVEAYSQLHYYQYMRPTDQNELLSAYCRSIFTGTIRHPWIDQQVESFVPDYRIIKAVRANLFLKWVRNEFPEISLLFIMRHPCAVVLSWMKLNWTAEKDIERLLTQPKLIQDFLIDKMDVIRKAEYPEEKQAVIWCVNNLIPIEQFRGSRLHVVFYENLCLFPDTEVAALFRAINQPYNEDVLTMLPKPSTTSHFASAIITGKDMVERWRTELDKEQIQRIRSIVSAFGLDHIYGDSAIPQVSSPLAYGE